MKKRVLFIIIMVIIASRPAHSDILANRSRKLLPAYIDAHERHSMGLSVPLRWAPEVKAWAGRTVALPLKGQVNPYTSMKQRSILGETETLPETAATLYFQDSDGVVYHLLPQTYEDIEGDPLIDDPSSFIEDVLLSHSKVRNEAKTKWAYYIRRSNERYEVVVVGIADREIETAYVGDERPEKDNF